MSKLLQAEIAPETFSPHETSEDKARLLLSSILKIKDCLRTKSLNARKAVHRLAKELRFVGFANPKLQKQLYKETLSYRTSQPLRRTQIRPEQYLQQRLAPYHLLHVLSDKVLDAPQYIRIGKDWITHKTSSAKRRIVPRDLGPEQLIKWLRSETYNSISRHLEAIAESDLEQQDPLDNALPLQDFENVWRDENAPISFRFDRRRFWDVRDPLLILECLEEKGLWRWRGNRLQPEAPAPAERIVAEMKAHATPQTGRYLRSLERLIAKGIEPQLLEDRELAANRRRDRSAAESRGPGRAIKQFSVLWPPNQFCRPTRLQ